MGPQQLMLDCVISLLNNGRCCKMTLLMKCHRACR